MDRETTTITECVHDLSYVLKADLEGNLVAILEQIPTVVVSGSLDDMDDRVRKAAKQHLKKFTKDHERIIHDNSPKYKDEGIAITLGNKQIQVQC
jgi:hypothetical protein